MTTANNKEKTTTMKRDFIAFISRMSHSEINEYIQSHGKPPKPLRLYHLIDKDKYPTYDSACNTRRFV